jgi:FkbM family methyltransferase
MMRRMLRRPAGLLRRRGTSARLDAQHAAVAELRLALDRAVLALDQRMLDHYALTELALAETRLRADAIENVLKELAGPGGTFAELIASEGALFDGYLAHHIAELRRDLGVSRGAVSPSAPGLDLLILGGDYDLVVPSIEQGLVAYLLRHGFDTIEPGVRAAMIRELGPGASAVDAGANVGLHALAMANAVGSEGRLLCFEPVPHLAAVVRRALAVNGLADRAEVRAIALADSAGTSTFHVAEHGPMSSLFALPAAATAESIEVERSTLDAQIPAGTRVDLVKLDVEGAEALAWRGAARVRQDNPEIVFILEWSASHFRRAGIEPDAFMSEIQAEGFAAFRIATDDPAGAVGPLDDDPAKLEGGNVLLRRA